jgi:hypothetical protein
LWNRPLRPYLSLSLADAETQTQPWDEQEIMDKWKKEFAVTQDKSLEEHRLLWLNHIYSNWEALEQTCQESSCP